MSFASGVGLASGIDFSSMIAQIRAVNSRPISLIQQRQRTLDVQKGALQEINRTLMDFKTQVERMSSRTSFRSLNVSSTDSKVVDASVDADAEVGNYYVKVLQTAQFHRIAAQGVENVDTTSIASAAGTLELQVGDTSPVSVDVTAGMSLRELRDAINASGGDIHASVINDGTATSANRLVLTSKADGANGKIEILNNDTILNLTGTTIEAATANSDNNFDGTVTSSGTYTGSTTKNIVVEVTTAGALEAAQFKVSYDGGLTWTADDAFTASATPVDLGEGVEISFGAGTQNFVAGDQFTIDAFAPQLQAAQNAVIQVDGIQISRPTNSFDDVVDGLTLRALKSSDDVQTISINNNTTSIEGDVNDFVTSYNKLVNTIAELTAYNVETQQAAPLFGDTTVNSVLNQLRSQMTSVLPLVGDLNSLSAIGIRVNGSGELDFDKTVLREKLKDDPEAVSRLFTEGGQSTNSRIELASSTEATKVGNYDINVTQAATQAAVTGVQVIDALAADELLTVKYGDRQTSISLKAGSSLSEIVTQINAWMEDHDFAVKAVDDNGQLKLYSVEYGSDQRLEVYSNKDAATANQLGIGPTTIVSNGLDVEGTINGRAVTGTGQTLEGITGTDSEGLKLTITATSATSGRLTLTHGIAKLLEERLSGITDSETGLIATRTDSIDTQYEDYNKRIEDMQRRLDQEEETLRAKFNRLELKLAELQSEGNFLMSQLTQLIG